MSYFFMYRLDSAKGRVKKGLKCRYPRPVKTPVGAAAAGRAGIAAKECKPPEKASAVRLALGMFQPVGAAGRAGITAKECEPPEKASAVRLALGMFQPVGAAAAGRAGIAEKECEPPEKASAVRLAPWTFQPVGAKRPCDICGIRTCHSGAIKLPR